MEMKEEWLMPGAVVPVDAETTAALVAEIKRLIGVVGDMALNMQPAQHERVQPDSECKEDDGCPTEKAVLQRFWRKAQQQEPVAQEWRYYFSHSGATGKPDEVVGPCFTDRKEVAFGVGCFDQTALSPPHRKPLTDEEIVKITSDPILYIRGGDYRIDIARAIEAAHGIKGEA